MRGVGWAERAERSLEQPRSHLQGKSPENEVESWGESSHDIPDCKQLAPLAKFLARLISM